MKEKSNRYTIDTSRNWDDWLSTAMQIIDGDTFTEMGEEEYILGDTVLQDYSEQGKAFFIISDQLFVFDNELDKLHFALTEIDGFGRELDDIFHVFQLEEDTHPIFPGVWMGYERYNGREIMTFSIEHDLYFLDPTIHGDIVQPHLEKAVRILEDDETRSLDDWHINYHLAQASICAGVALQEVPYAKG